MDLTRRKSPATQTPTPPKSMKKSLSNVGEVAGGTAANCAVVTCCCPCVMFECILLIVYKVPASIFRRIWRKKRQKRLIKKKVGFLKEEESGCSSVGEVYDKRYVDEVSDVDLKEFEMIKVSIDGSAVELDKKMWDRFHNTGFWRSPSQRE